MAFLSYRGGPNLLDDKWDRGREYQADMIAGHIVEGTNWRRDTINPTQGAGDYGRRYTPLLEWVVGDDYAEGLVEAHDYTPNRSPYLGAWRVRAVAGRYPRTGWFLRARYELRGSEVTLRSEWRHDEAEAQPLVAIRNSVHPRWEYIQRPLVNEDRRAWSSHCADRIDDSEIVANVSGGLRLRFRCLEGHALMARFADYSTGRECAQLPPGEARDVSLWAESPPRLVRAGEVVRQTTVVGVST
jgi:hypothetical protein